MSTTAHRILLVEGELAVATVLSDTLGRAGLPCSSVHSARACVAWLADHTADLLILGNSLPDLSPVELLAELRRTRRLRPFIARTNPGDNDLAVELMKSGALDCLVNDSRLPDILAGATLRALSQIATQQKLAAAEEALRESEQRYRLLLTSTTDYIYSVQIKGGQPVATFHGAGCTKVTGYSPEDYAENPRLWLEMVPPEDRPSVERHARAATAGEVLGPIEHRIIRKDGSPGWVQNTMVPRRDRTGRLVACEGIVNDITARKQTEDDLRRSTRWLLATQRISTVGGWALSLNSGAAWASPEARRLYGIGDAPLTVSLVQSLPLPQFRPVLDRALRRLVEHGEPYDLEFQIRRLNDGAIVDIHSLAEYDPNERVVIGALQDITERKRTENELRKLSQAVEQSPVSVIITDATGAIEYCNRYFTATTGYALAEVRGQTPRILGSGETPAGTYRTMWETITAGREWHGEFHNRRKDGTLFWEAATIGPILDADGKVSHFLAVKEDITDRKLAAAALTASERRFRSLVESVPNIAVQGYDRDRRVIFWNAASETLFGYTQAEAMGRRREDLIIPPESRDAVVTAVEGLLVRNEPIPAGKMILRRKDGRLVSVHSSHVKLERADGEPEMHCVDIDLTAREQAERALEESHDFHLRMLSHAPALIWRSGPDGKCNWLNASWLAFTGNTMEQELGDGWSPSVHPDDRQRCIDTHSAAFAARRSFEVEYRLRRHDGVYRWISDNGSPFNSLTGEFGGFIGYCFDITDRRAADDRIREQAALLDVAQDAIMVTTLDRTITYWNRTAETLYGIPAGEASGRKLEELTYRELPPGYEEVWAQIVKHPEWSGDRQHLTRSGRTVDVRIRSSLVRDARGAPKSVLLIVTDVTESKKMEAQFLRAQRLESLGALASGVAHDLNNVLTPILMSIELLRPLAQAPHDHDMLRLLSDSARRGTEIVQQLLLFGRGSDSPRSAMSVAAVIKDVGRMLRSTFPKNLALSLQAPADLWLINADATQVHQVLLNLCVNARDAMPRGGRLSISAENIHVDETLARNHGGSTAGSYVRLQVRDTGTGISPAHLDKIFDPFFTTKPIGEGTGLGLATVLGIVRSHGGFLAVASQEGVGTVFDVHLPAAVSALEAAGPSGVSSPLRGNGEWLLIVDDEEAIRSLLQRTLVRHNYNVLVVADGAEALGVFAQNVAKIKLVITDMMMPVMDGTQMVHALRRLSPSLPVVAISGLTSHRADFEKNFGPHVRFLPKPFLPDAALRLVREALDETETSSPSSPS